MLSTAQKELLGKVLPKGITVEVLTKAISSDKEEELEIPNGRFLTTDDETILLKNHGDKEYHNGKVKQTEMLLKDLSKKAGFDTVKDADAFIETFKTETLKNAKVEPDKKLEEMQTSLTTLQNKYETDIAAKDQLIIEKESKLKSIENNSKIQSVLPKLKDGITKDVAITMFNSVHELKEDGIYKNGQLLKNDLQTPLTHEEAINSFLTERDWIQKDVRGNGGKGQQYQGAIPKTYDEFEKYCESKDITVGSQEANQQLEKFAKNNPDFYND